MNRKVITGVVAGAFGALFAMQASAASVTAGRDGFCNTGGLDGCFVSAEGLERTEAIAKLEFGEIVNLTANTGFGDDDIDLTDIVTLGDFDLSGLTFNADGTGNTGTISYTIGSGEPGITAFSTKRGQLTELFYGDAISYDAGTMTFTFDVGSGQGLSNLVIYDNFAPIPVPAAGFMLLAGLGGLVAARRRKG